MNDTGIKFEDLPEELQIYILSRLPPKSLSICKRVSEHWNTLTIQVFLLRHSISYDKHSKLAFVKYSTTQGYESVISFELCDNTTTKRKTMTVPKTTKMRLENSGTIEELIKGHHQRLFCRHMSNICNDLVCLVGRFSPLVGLLNLRTHDFINLPAVPTQNLGRTRYWCALGFDPVNKVYKVLSIYGGGKVCSNSKAAIFTLGRSKHWKPVEFKFLRCAVTMKWDDWKNNNMFCLDGVIYWVNDYEIHGTRVLTVVAFDLNSEVFTEYKFDTIPIKDGETIRYYYLTSLKGHPSLFIWKKESDEIQQLTLFNHTYPKVTWYRRSFTANDFPKNFPYGRPGTFVAGGSILLQSVKPIESSVEPEEQSWYKWSDLENFDID
ncbi:F-box/kelch-repeat protein At3g04660-like [Silene latifolia]|uniref:F-box/kelch-repeat protein At3g04660-like n=1 Tax=Silene latifolia TaxID=37657 RepID=UPI003D781F6F